MAAAFGGAGKGGPAPMIAKYDRPPGLSTRTDMARGPPGGPSTKRAARPFLSRSLRTDHLRLIHRDGGTGARHLQLLHDPKTLAGLARYLGTQQGVNFCNGADPILTAAINNALTGTTDASGSPAIAGLTPDMIQVSIEHYDPMTQQLSPCACCAPGCDASQGGIPPGYIVVSLANGYTVQPLFWGFTINPFPLQPSVTVPYGGT